MTPVISIIVPVYNVEQYLEQCLNSILNQDFQQWECILIDDGSTDRSGAICDEFSLRDGRFHVLHNVNRGVSSARNTGLALAKGDWICFVDSDDQLVEDGLSHMLDVNIRMNADVCICPIVRDTNFAHEIKILDDAEKRLLIWACLSYRTESYVAKGFLVDAPHAKLFRSSVIRTNKLKYVDGLCKSEDALFDAQFYHLSTRIVMDTYPVYQYTINPNSICHTYKFQNIHMFGILLQHEEDFVSKWYCDIPMFKNILKVRTFVALEQVLYEAGADQFPLSLRVKALRIFINSGEISRIISDTRYSEIAPYMSGRSRRVDLFLVQMRMFIALCLWVDLCKSIFRIRVSIVENLKKILRIDQNTSFRSLFCK